MDIDLNDNTESNNFCINNNDNLKNNNLFETGKGEDFEMNIFQPNHKCIYGVNSPFFKSKKPNCELTLCEGRLQNDLAELKRSKIFGKICQIKYDNTPIIKTSTVFKQYSYKNSLHDFLKTFLNNTLRLNGILNK